MKVFVCICGDCRLLPHFLAHYARFGLTEFHIASDRAMASEIRSLSQGFAVTQHHDLDVADSITGGAAAVTQMRMMVQGPDEWAVIVDLDEFVEFGRATSVLIRAAQAQQANAIRAVMVDRFAADGKVKPIDARSVLPELFPVRARFIKEVMKGYDMKTVAVRGHLQSKIAHHTFFDERPYSKVLEIAHYKWIDTALDRLAGAYETLVKDGVPWAAEYKRALAHYEAHGRFAWETFGGESVATPSTEQVHCSRISTTARPC